MKSDFVWSQTALKDFEAEATCPMRWKAQWVGKVIPFPSNEAMDKGKFFEYLVIGGGAIEGEAPILELPKTTTGKVSIDEVRIRQQAEYAKTLFDESHDNFLGIRIVDTQVVLSSDGQEISRRGVADIVGEDVLTGDIWLLDLKLTSDANSTRTQYSYGNLHLMDHIQLVHYWDILKDFYPDRKVRVGYMVFDYNKNMNSKFIELKFSEVSVQEALARFQQADDVYQLYEQRGWTTYPSESECERCPLRCSDRFSPELKIQKIQHELP